MTKLRTALLVLAATALAAAAGVAPDARAAGSPRAEGFDTPTWWQRWGMATAPFNTEVVDDGAGGGFLRVHIAAGSHDGSSFLLPTGNADHVRLTYRLRVDDAFDPSKADHNVKLPGFGKPVFAATGQCLVACGGAPADGVLGYSARADVDEQGTPGFYVYDTTLGRWGRGFRWATGALTPGVWHTVQLEIEMNDPARDDGTLLATLDGARVFAAHDLHLRWTSALHVGGAWFDIYYGGAGVSPAATAVDVDDAVIEVL